MTVELSYIFYEVGRHLGNVGVMLKHLKDRYDSEGFVSPIRILDGSGTVRHRVALEDAEARIAPLHYKFKVHTILRSPFELATHPAMLDVAEALLGPNIPLYGATYVVKEPHTPAHVSWHQLLTYWSLSSTLRCRRGWPNTGDLDPAALAKQRVLDATLNDAYAVMKRAGRA